MWIDHTFHTFVHFSIGYGLYHTSIIFWDTNEVFTLEFRVSNFDFEKFGHIIDREVQYHGNMNNWTVFLIKAKLCVLQFNDLLEHVYRGEIFQTKVSFNFNRYRSLFQNLRIKLGLPYKELPLGVIMVSWFEMNNIFYTVLCVTTLIHLYKTRGFGWGLTKNDTSWQWIIATFCSQMIIKRLILHPEGNLLIFSFNQKNPRDISTSETMIKRAQSCTEFNIDIFWLMKLKLCDSKNYLDTSVFSVTVM